MIASCRSFRNFRGAQTYLHHIVPHLLRRYVIASGQQAYRCIDHSVSSDDAHHVSTRETVSFIVYCASLSLSLCETRMPMLLNSLIFERRHV